MTQMALPLRLADHAVFETYLPAGNEALVATLVDLARGQAGQGAWIFGPVATGKTHLLQATCERAGDRSVYVPVGQMAESEPGILEGLASRELICLDDIDAVAGDARWEEALFSLCNEALDAGSALLDLRSRLSRLATFQVNTLSEAQRVLALQLRARHRGLELPDDTAQFLLNRSRRDMASLYALLDKLDLEALRAKRRLTIPFVKEVL